MSLAATAKQPAISLLAVPYDSAQRDVRMGAGPNALMRAGLVERLAAAGTDCELEYIEPNSGFRAEVATAFDLHAQVRNRVEAAQQAGRLPICLTGNCNTGVIGSLAAHSASDVGLFWFDAHSDAETPESSTSGFFDGMGLAVALGACWRPMLEQLGWLGIEGRKAVLVCPREVTAAANSLLGAANVSVILPEVARTADAATAMGPALERLRTAGVKRVHVHVDLDVLDPDLVGPANGYALSGGLTTGQLLDQLRAILDAFALASASVASYDPAVDRSGAVAEAGLQVIALLATRSIAR